VKGRGGLRQWPLPQAIEGRVIAMGNYVDEYQVVSRRVADFPVKIRDVSGVILFSSELTRVVIAALGRAVRAAVLQGVVEVMLTITKAKAEIDFITFNGRIRRRLSKFHTVVDLYSREFERAEASHYDPQFKQEWLRRIEQMFYLEMSTLE
jgi:hypothetical protein